MVINNPIRVRPYPFWVCTMKKFEDLWEGQAALSLPQTEDQHFHADKAKFHRQAAEFFTQGGLHDRAQFQQKMADLHNKKSQE